MKKVCIVLAVVLVYTAAIWLIRTNETAMTIAKWVVGIPFAAWGLDWLIGQFAGLFSEKLQEKLAAAFLPLSVAVLALLPIFLAVIIKK